MLVTFLIVLALVVIFGSGRIEDACAITLLLKILPIIILILVVCMILFCHGYSIPAAWNLPEKCVNASKVLPKRKA